MAANRRREKAQETRDAILECGLRLFEEHGFDAVSVEQITREAGVAKGTFYTHFSTKSDIIVAEFWVIDEYYRTYSERNLRRYATAGEKLTAFTRAQMRYVRDVVGNAKLKILYANQTSEPGSAKVITNRDRQWHQIVKRIITEGQAEGEFRTDLEAERLTVLFNRSARGVLLDWCIADGSFDLVKEGVRSIQEWVAAALSGT